MLKNVSLFYKLSSFLIFIFTSLPVSASVSLRNGNFFIGYTDIVYPGGFDTKIERVYNSKTPYNGIFGWGWGNEFEVFLTVSADGSVVVNEYGGGAQNRFSPVAFNAKELQKAVDLIADTAKKMGAVGSEDQLIGYKQKLKSDALFRNDEWQKFRAQGKLQPRQLSVGAQLTSNRFSYQYITKVADGYVRNFDSGKTEKFNEAGRLVRISDKNNNFIDISYDKSGRIEKILDNFHRKMFFTLNSQGKVEKVQGENNKEVVYKYNEMGELVSSKDVDGNYYVYKYSSDKRHNMIEIAYSDKTKLSVSYYGLDKQENVKSVTERDGTVTEYGYDRDSADQGHSMVKITIKGTDGKPISSSQYDYFVKNRADGEEWTYKMISSLDGDRTETSYNEMNLPTRIKKGKDETLFEYDNKGHVTKKVTPAETTTLAYDKAIGKITKVVRQSRSNKKDTSWSEFSYDNKGNLVVAKNSDKKGVKLFYDTNGRIKSMVDQGKRRIDFKYNENSKPVEIADPSLGSITVTYTNSGEVKKVESSAGRRIAVQVTSAFQNLLDIIRPAGVTLSF